MGMWGSRSRDTQSRSLGGNLWRKTRMTSTSIYRTETWTMGGSIIATTAGDAMTWMGISSWGQRCAMSICGRMGEIRNSSSTGPTWNRGRLFGIEGSFGSFYRTLKRCLRIRICHSKEYFSEWLLGDRPVLIGKRDWLLAVPASVYLRFSIGQGRYLNTIMNNNQIVKL